MGTSTIKEIHINCTELKAKQHKNKKSLSNFVQHDFEIYEKISFANRNKINK